MDRAPSSCARACKKIPLHLRGRLDLQLHEDRVQCIRFAQASQYPDRLIANVGGGIADQVDEPGVNFLRNGLSCSDCG